MKNKYPKTLTASLMTFALFAGSANAAVIFNSNFSFLSGTPVSGTLTQEGVVFTVATTNTEMYNPGGGLTAFKNQGGLDALVTFTFSEVITDFSFIVGRVANDEYIDNFLLGNDSSSLSTFNPTIAPGSDLISTGSGSGFKVSTSNSGDAGTGTLSWTGLTNTKIVQFTIDVTAGSGAALDVERFTAIAVPEPSTFLYLASLSLATLGFGAFRRKRRGANFSRVSQG
jgi:hypothetical protein